MEREVLALLVLVPDHVMRTGDDARRTPGAQPARDDLRVELLPLRGPALGHRPNIDDKARPPTGAGSPGARCRTRRSFCHTGRRRGGVALRIGRQDGIIARPPAHPLKRVGSETFDCSSSTVERPISMLLASTGSDRSENFVDLDVTAAAWIVLLVLIVVMLGIDLYRHREAHAPTTREAL